MQINDKPSDVREFPQMIRGVVVSDKMDKTCVIEVVRRLRHSLYHKNIVRRSRLFVHDEKEQATTGDYIEAVATRPLSRKKNFRLFKILGKKVTE